LDLLNAMRLFACVAAEGSLAGCARALGRPLDEVARGIDELEEHLGAELLRPGHQGLALTTAGLLYLQRVKRILQALDQADALARQPVG
jgi:DNA-binding transcriptional LysR family regulator